jgi:hypothetical protein
VGFGAPWLGAMQFAPYFPPKLISMFWPDYWRGQDLMFISMLLIAGIENYLLLRSMGVGREGATFSALAYMLCQRLFLLINMPAFTIEALLPLMLYAINEMVKRKSLGFALFAGAIGGAHNFSPVFLKPPAHSSWRNSLRFWRPRTRSTPRVMVQ